MTGPISFADKPVLVGRSILLRPLDSRDVDDIMTILADPELLRLTGTHTTFTRDRIEQHCATRAEHDDRLDYAVVELATGAFLGELAITDLDPDNLSCAFRIALRTDMAGRGFGTEATTLIVEHVLGVGVHRIELEVYAFNPRARRVYEKVGFVREGTLRCALHWEGRWVDADLMALLATDPRPARSAVTTS